MTEVAKFNQPQTLPADPMVSMIERIALDPNADLDKLERMLAMKERMDEKAAREVFSNAMASCQAEMQPVARNKSNDQTRSRYADLAAIYAACKPICAKHGFSFSTFPASSDKPGHMGVRWTLRHAGGHEESELAEIPIDDKGMKGTANKTQTHAFGSTASYARRYLFCMIFDIATNDDNDGNNQSRAGFEPVTIKQVEGLRALIQQSGADEDAFLRALKIEALDDLPQSRFYEAEALLRRKLAAKEAGNA